MVHLSEARLPKKMHTKLQMKKIGPYQVLYKFGENVFEISLPPTLSIYPILNVCDLTPFKGDVGTSDIMQDLDEQAEWIKDLSSTQPLQLD